MTYPFVPPQQRFIGPLLIVKKVDNVLVKNLSVEFTVYIRPGFLFVQDMSTLEMYIGQTRVGHKGEATHHDSHIRDILGCNLCYIVYFSDAFLAGQCSRCLLQCGAWTGEYMTKALFRRQQHITHDITRPTAKRNGPWSREWSTISGSYPSSG